MNDRAPDRWFEDFGTVQEGRELLFLKFLRERASGWSAFDVTPADTQAWREERDALMVHCDIVDRDPASRLVIGTLAAEYSSGEVRGRWAESEWIEGTNFRVPAEDDFTRPGPLNPEAAADVTADWFEQELRRQVDILEWLSDGKVVRRVRVLADTGKWLAEWEYAAPPGTRDRPPDRSRCLRGA